MMKLKHCTLSLVAILMISFSVLGNTKESNAVQVLRLSTAELDKSRAYSLYQKNPHDPKSEINYLINLIEQSPYTYVRNDRQHTSEQAAKFLKLRLIRARKSITKTEDFINKCASYSSKTGQPYYIVDENGQKYPSKDVLYSELQNLREFESGLTAQSNS